MSWSVPTLEKLLDQAIRRHRAELPGTDAYLWPNTEHVFLKTVAGLVHLNFEYLDWIKRQRFAHEADGDELPAHGKAWNIARNPASAAHGSIIITGTPGTTVGAGTIVQRSDAVQFATAAAVVIPAGGATDVAVTAVVAGAAGNTDALTILTLAAPIAGVDEITVDSVGLGGGADIEDLEAYRSRILFRQWNEPMGGNEADYVRWAFDVSGVTRVWAEALAFGPGTVGVWFMTDGSTANGIPGPVAVADVLAHLQSRRPSTARLVVKAPLEAKLDINIQGIRPTDAMQDKISAEIDDVFRRRVAPSTPLAPFTFTSAAIWQAVARVTGDVTHRVALPADVTLPTGYIPVKGTICYT